MNFPRPEIASFTSKNFKIIRAVKFKMEKRIPKPGDRKSGNDRDIKLLIEFLVLNSYPEPISLPLLQTPDLKLFWTIIEFILKLIDSSIPCFTASEFTDLLRYFGYSQPLPSKMFTDESNWGKLISLALWISRIAIYKAEDDFSYFNQYFISAYTCVLNEEDHSLMQEEFINQLAGINNSLDKSIEEHRKEIDEIRTQKNKMTAETAEEIEERILNASNELYIEIEKISVLETQYGESRSVCKSSSEKLKQMLGGRYFNDNLIPILKQDLNKIQNDCFAAVTLLNDIQSKIEIAREEKEGLEKMGVNRPIEKQLLEIQENIDVVRRNNLKITEEIKMCDKNIEDIALEITGSEGKFKKEQNQAHAIIADDREAISKHARKVADWLEGLDENNYLY